MWTMNFSWQAVLAAVFGLTALHLQAAGPKRLFVFAAAGNEDDVRIAAGKAAGEAALDLGQQEAESYIKHRDNGNIEKARALGSALGQMVLADMPQLEANLKDWILIDHGKMLYIFVAERAIRDLAPDTILSQVSIEAFRQVVTAQIEAVYEGLAGSRADTFYQLSYFRRPASQVAYHMGRTYAQLCGREDEEPVLRLGQGMFSKMYEKCQAACRQTQYAL